MPEVILGAAQLGLSYGIANRTGMPGVSEVKKIFDVCQRNSIRLIDTADGYGSSQAVIKENSEARFEVASKFRISSMSFADTLDNTLLSLGVSSLWCYSFHSCDDMFKFSDWSSIVRAKELGKIERIGVSVYSISELESSLSNDYIDVIQTPFNILDGWRRRGALIARAKELGKIVHVRSIFLQGLLLMDASQIPPQLDIARPYLEKIKGIAEGAKISVEELSLRYALSFPGIDGLVIGVEVANQLEANLKIVKLGALPTTILSDIREVVCDDERILYPYNWVNL